MEKCSKEDFVILMQCLKFPEKYYRDILLDSLYKTYLNSDGKTMNVAKFCEDCINLKEDNDLMAFKDRTLNFLEKKISEQNEENEKTVRDLKEEKIKRISLLKDLDTQEDEKQYIFKKIWENNKNKYNGVINTQPSTEFIKKVYKDNRKMFNILNDAEERLCSKPNIVGIGKAKTRFNGNPPHKDTFYMINQDKRGSSYIDEKDRFSVTCTETLTDFIRKDKEMKKQKQEAKLRKIREYEDMREKACKTMEKIFEQKDKFAQNKRSLRIFEYEVRNKIRNSFVE